MFVPAEARRLRVIRDGTTAGVISALPTKGNDVLWPQRGFTFLPRF